MKIRTDFVTNSSSTSFVIITADGFERDDFLELMGVTEQSPLRPLFDALYDILQDSMHLASEYVQRHHKTTTSNWLELLKNELADEIVERIIRAEKTEGKVFIGKLSSDNNLIESFFCTNSFEVENEKIYFNALECAW